MREPRRRRPAPPPLSFSAGGQRWTRIVALSERETNYKLAPDVWVLFEAVRGGTATVTHVGAPVQVFLWGDGCWQWVPGPLRRGTIFVGDPDGFRLALRAEGPAEIRGGILRQQGKEEIEWPGLDPPEHQKRCDYRATNGINGSDCDVAFSTDRRLCCDLHYVVEPGSVWETERGRRALDAELRRCQAWWAHYCIYLAFRAVSLPARDRAKLQRNCLAWKQAYPRDSEDATREFHALTYWLYGVCNRVARAKRTVMFFDRCLSWRSGSQGTQGHNNTDLVGVSRATPGSATVIGRDAIIIHGVEVGSAHVVTHELIHLLGRSANAPFAQSQTTWNHNSACQESMSTAPARGLAAFVFEDSRLLDVAEYPEIAQAGHVKRC